MEKDYSNLDLLLPQMRKEYTAHALVETGMDADPLAQFGRWFDEAVVSGNPMPNAMSLATASKDGRPSARIMLLKGFDVRGFVFYTDYASPKGRDLEENPNAETVFYWPELERQVRISGRIEKMSGEESQVYFQSRPFQARIAALVSRQSQGVKSREELEVKFHEMEKKYQHKEVPCPPNWGGYRLKPSAIEFWQGRPNRLNDRIRYRARLNGNWRIERIQP